MRRFCLQKGIIAENLESKMKWLKNFERLQELQQQIIWRPITEMEPRAFIPEVMYVVRGNTSRRSSF